MCKNWINVLQWLCWVGQTVPRSLWRSLFKMPHSLVPQHMGRRGGPINRRSELVTRGIGRYLTLPIPYQFLT